MIRMTTRSEEKVREWLRNQSYSDIEKIDEKGQPDFLADGDKVEAKKPIYPWDISGRARLEEIGTIFITEPQAENFPETNPLVVVVDKEHLFDIEENAKSIGGSLDDETVPEQLKERFEEEGYPLSEDVSASVLVRVAEGVESVLRGERWEIKDEEEGHSYEVRKIVVEMEIMSEEEMKEEFKEKFEERGGREMVEEIAEERPSLTEDEIVDQIEEEINEEITEVTGDIDLSVYGDKIRPIPFDEIGEHYNIRVGNAMESVPFEEFRDDEGCFIATASLGTPSRSKLDVLREFRDNELRESLVGENLVRLYYEVSPPVADLISKSEKLQSASRRLLVEPLVEIIEG